MAPGYWLRDLRAGKPWAFPTPKSWKNCTHGRSMEVFCSVRCTNLGAFLTAKVAEGKKHKKQLGTDQGDRPGSSPWRSMEIHWLNLGLFARKPREFTGNLIFDRSLKCFGVPYTLVGTMVNCTLSFRKGLQKTWCCSFSITHAGHRTDVFPRWRAAWVVAVREFFKISWEKAGAKALHVWLDDELNILTA